MIYCAWCGEVIGEGRPSYPGDADTCGAPECEREVRNMLLAEREEARYAAEQDDYERYR